VPEELLAIQAKNESIRKEIRKTLDKYEHEKSEMEKLVPPSVIENMNKKISAIIATNDKLNETLKAIDDITR
jgi:vacuolar-type H+-ATPase subunit I/STV1